MEEAKYVYDGKNYSKKEMQDLVKISIQSLKKNESPRFRETLKMLEGESILDVGCASGSVSQYIGQLGYNVHGIDVLENSIKIAKEFFHHKNVTYEVRDLIKNPFPENSFDCILFLETIEHVKNPVEFFKEFHRILKPNGVLILSTPNATSLKNMFYALSYRKLEKRKLIINELTKEQKHTGTHLEHIFNWDFPVLVRLLDMCGFETIDHKFTGSGPIVISILGKKIQIIKRDSKILNNFETLKTTHVMKARKKN
jgi:2-polyprenyl-3-methyl-5-hydroxy-6-metoxy-1,4-benzoquinol methylase